LPRDRTFRGTIRVTIDEVGRVENAVMMKPVHPLYDPILLDAARSWRYVPAKRGGLAVKYVKTVDVTLVPPEVR
jgi:TonB family protein